MMHSWRTANNSHAVPTISSVLMRSSKANSFEIIGAAVTLTCTVELGPAVVESDLSLLEVDAQLSRDGTALDLTSPTVSDTTFTYVTQLNSFGRNDSGNYTCTATVRPQSTSTYLTGSAVLSDTIYIQAGTAILYCMPPGLFST